MRPRSASTTSPRRHRLNSTAMAPGAPPARRRGNSATGSRGSDMTTTSRESGSTQHRIIADTADLAPALPYVLRLDATTDATTSVGSGGRPPQPAAPHAQKSPPATSLPTPPGRPASAAAVKGAPGSSRERRAPIARVPSGYKAPPPGAPPSAQQRRAPPLRVKSATTSGARRYMQEYETNPTGHNPRFRRASEVDAAAPPTPGHSPHSPSLEPPTRIGEAATHGKTKLGALLDSIDNEYSHDTNTAARRASGTGPLYLAVPAERETIVLSSPLVDSQSPERRGSRGRGSLIMVKGPPASPAAADSPSPHTSYPLDVDRARDAFPPPQVVRPISRASVGSIASTSSAARPPSPYPSEKRSVAPPASPVGVKVSSTGGRRASFPGGSAASTPLSPRLSAPGVKSPPSPFPSVKTPTLPGLVSRASFTSSGDIPRPPSTTAGTAPASARESTTTGDHDDAGNAPPRDTPAMPVPPPSAVSTQLKSPPTRRAASVSSEATSIEFAESSSPAPQARMRPTGSTSTSTASDTDTPASETPCERAPTRAHAFDDATTDATSMQFHEVTPSPTTVVSPSPALAMATEDDAAAGRRKRGEGGKREGTQGQHLAGEASVSPPFTLTDSRGPSMLRGAAGVAVGSDDETASPPPARAAVAPRTPSPESEGWVLRASEGPAPMNDASGPRASREPRHTYPIRGIRNAPPAFSVSPKRGRGRDAGEGEGRAGRAAAGHRPTQHPSAGVADGKAASEASQGDAQSTQAGLSASAREDDNGDARAKAPASDSEDRSPTEVTGEEEAVLPTDTTGLEPHVAKRMDRPLFNALAAGATSSSADTDAARTRGQHSDVALGDDDAACGGGAPQAHGSHRDGAVPPNGTTTAQGGDAEYPKSEARALRGQRSTRERIRSDESTRAHVQTPTATEEPETKPGHVGPRRTGAAGTAELATFEATAGPAGRTHTRHENRQQRDGCDAGGGVSASASPITERVAALERVLMDHVEENRSLHAGVADAQRRATSAADARSALEERLRAQAMDDTLLIRLQQRELDRRRDRIQSLSVSRSPSPRRSVPSHSPRHCQSGGGGARGQSKSTSPVSPVWDRDRVRSGGGGGGGRKTAAWKATAPPAARSPNGRRGQRLAYGGGTAHGSPRRGAATSGDARPRRATPPSHGRHVFPELRFGMPQNDGGQGEGTMWGRTGESGTHAQAEGGGDVGERPAPSPQNPQEPWPRDAAECTPAPSQPAPHHNSGDDAQDQSVGVSDVGEDSSVGARGGVNDVEPARAPPAAPAQGRADVIRSYHSMSENDVAERGQTAFATPRDAGHPRTATAVALSFDDDQHSIHSRAVSPQRRRPVGGRFGSVAGRSSGGAVGAAVTPRSAGRREKLAELRERVAAIEAGVGALRERAGCAEARSRELARAARHAEAALGDASPSGVAGVATGPGTAAETHRADADGTPEGMTHAEEELHRERAARHAAEERAAQLLLDAKQSADDAREARRNLLAAHRELGAARATIQHLSSRVATPGRRHDIDVDGTHSPPPAAPSRAASSPPHPQPQAPDATPSAGDYVYRSPSGVIAAGPPPPQHSPMQPPLFPSTSSAALSRQPAVCPSAHAPQSTDYREALRAHVSDARGTATLLAYATPPQGDSYVDLAGGGGDVDHDDHRYLGGENYGQDEVREESEGATPGTSPRRRSASSTRSAGAVSDTRDMDVGPSESLSPPGDGGALQYDDDDAGEGYGVPTADADRGPSTHVQEDDVDRVSAVTRSTSRPSVRSRQRMTSTSPPSRRSPSLQRTRSARADYEDDLLAVAASDSSASGKTPPNNTPQVHQHLEPPSSQLQQAVLDPAEPATGTASLPARVRRVSSSGVVYHGRPDSAPTSIHGYRSTASIEAPSPKPWLVDERHPELPTQAAASTAELTANRSPRASHAEDPPRGSDACARTVTPPRSRSRSQSMSELGSVSPVSFASDGEDLRYASDPVAASGHAQAHSAGAWNGRDARGGEGYMDNRQMIHAQKAAQQRPVGRGSPPPPERVGAGAGGYTPMARRDQGLPAAAPLPTTSTSAPSEPRPQHRVPRVASATSAMKVVSPTNAHSRASTRLGNSMGAMILRQSGGQLPQLAAPSLTAEAIHSHTSVEGPTDTTSIVDGRKEVMPVSATAAAAAAAATPGAIAPPSLPTPPVSATARAHPRVPTTTHALGKERAGLPGEGDVFHPNAHTTTSTSHPQGFNGSSGGGSRAENPSVVGPAPTTPSRGPAPHRPPQSLSRPASAASGSGRHHSVPAPASVPSSIPASAPPSSRGSGRLGYDAAASGVSMSEPPAAPAVSVVSVGCGGGGPLRSQQQQQHGIPAYASTNGVSRPNSIPVLPLKSAASGVGVGTTHRGTGPDVAGRRVSDDSGTRCAGIGGADSDEEPGVADAFEPSPCASPDALSPCYLVPQGSRSGQDTRGVQRLPSRGVDAYPVPTLAPACASASVLCRTTSAMGRSGGARLTAVVPPPAVDADRTASVGHGGEVPANSDGGGGATGAEVRRRPSGAAVSGAAGVVVAGAGTPRPAEGSVPPPPNDLSVHSAHSVASGASVHSVAAQRRHALRVLHNTVLSHGEVEALVARQQSLHEGARGWGDGALEVHGSDPTGAAAAARRSGRLPDPRRGSATPPEVTAEPPPPASLPPPLSEGSVERLIAEAKAEPPPWLHRPLSVSPASGDDLRYRPLNHAPSRETSPPMAVVLPDTLPGHPCVSPTRRDGRVVGGVRGAAEVGLGIHAADDATARAAAHWGWDPPPDAAVYRPLRSRSGSGASTVSREGYGPALMQCHEHRGAGWQLPAEHARTAAAAIFADADAGPSVGYGHAPGRSGDAAAAPPPRLSAEAREPGAARPAASARQRVLAEPSRDASAASGHGAMRRGGGGVGTFDKTARPAALPGVGGAVGGGHVHSVSGGVTGRTSAVRAPNAAPAAAAHLTRAM